MLGNQYLIDCPEREQALCSGSKRDTVCLTTSDLFYVWEFNNRECKKWQEQRLWQHQKWMIWWVEWGTLFGAIFWSSMPEDALKFSFLRFWPQHKPLALNLSFFASCMKISLCQGSERQLHLLCTTWPRWHNHKTLHLNQSSILMWHFRCFCDFFKLLITLWEKKLSLSPNKIN